MPGMGFAARLRAAKISLYDRQIAWLREKYPWVADYDIHPPVRHWRAFRPDGTEAGQAKNILKLEQAIRADQQATPIHPRPVALPERVEYEDPTRTDIPGWPYDQPRRAAS